MQLSKIATYIVLAVAVACSGPVKKKHVGAGKIVNDSPPTDTTFQFLVGKWEARYGTYLEDATSDRKWVTSRQIELFSCEIDWRYLDHRQTVVGTAVLGDSVIKMFFAYDLDADHWWYYGPWYQETDSVSLSGSALDGRSAFFTVGGGLYGGFSHSLSIVPYFGNPDRLEFKIIEETDSGAPIFVNFWYFERNVDSWRPN
jgi:hypothetical protein